MKVETFLVWRIVSRYQFLFLFKKKRLTSMEISRFLNSQELQCKDKSEISEYLNRCLNITDEALSAQLIRRLEMFKNNLQRYVGNAQLDPKVKLEIFRLTNSEESKDLNYLKKILDRNDGFVNKAMMDIMTDIFTKLSNS